VDERAVRNRDAVATCAFRDDKIARPEILDAGFEQRLH
jgi:hypothetical protein